MRGSEEDRRVADHDDRQANQQITKNVAHIFFLLPSQHLASQPQQEGDEGGASQAAVGEANVGIGEEPGIGGIDGEPKNESSQRPENQTLNHYHLLL